MIRIVNGLKIYYDAIGNGQPLLLLHGWGDSSDSMSSIAILSKRYGYKVYCIDLPGFGLSDSPPVDWGVHNYMNFVISFLDELKIRTVDIIAHSFGGRITISLSANYPNRVGKIALVDSAGIKPKRNLNYYASVFTYKTLKAFLKLFYGDSYKEVLLNKKLGSNDYKDAGNLRGTLVKVVNEDLTKYLPIIKAPTLLIWGDLDTQTPLKDGYKMRNLIANSELVIIKEAGHHCFIDRPDEFNSIITSYFLKRKYGGFVE